MSVKNRASIMAVLGSTGSGKSAFVKKEISRGHSRLLVWDPMGEYDGAIITTLAALLAALNAPKFRLVFRPADDDKTRVKQFDIVCRAAMAAGNLTFVVEELRFVTTPSRAPLGWAKVCMTGRHKGLKVFGLSQRPASIDKDFLGNCTRIRSGRLSYANDIKAVAAAIGNADKLAALQPLEWLECDMTNKKITAGKLTF